jgi:hypothetical protein
MRTFALLLTLVVVVALVPGCGGDGDTGPSNGVSDNPTLSQHIQPIFDNRCATQQCHGDAEQAGLSLVDGEAYGELVLTQSTSEPEYFRVMPGAPDSSYLVIKIEGNQSVGSRMPLTGGPLDSDSIQLIRNWILAGAQDD